MEPLKEFICDKCNKIIKCPEDGVIEWTWEDGIDKHLEKGFKLVHSDYCCSFYHGEIVNAWNELTQFLDSKQGIVEILNKIDEGLYWEPKYKGPNVSDLREYIELVRRLTVPYYDEARLYFSMAIEDGYFSEGDNQIYSAEKLKGIINKYSCQLIGPHQ